MELVHIVALSLRMAEAGSSEAAEQHRCEQRGAVSKALHVGPSFFSLQVYKVHADANTGVRGPVQLLTSRPTLRLKVGSPVP